MLILRRSRLALIFLFVVEALNVNAQSPSHDQCIRPTLVKEVNLIDHVSGSKINDLKQSGTNYYIVTNGSKPFDLGTILKLNAEGDLIASRSLPQRGQLIPSSFGVTDEGNVSLMFNGPYRKLYKYASDLEEQGNEDMSDTVGKWNLDNKRWGRLSTELDRLNFVGSNGLDGLNFVGSNGIDSVKIQLLNQSEIPSPIWSYGRIDGAQNWIIVVHFFINQLFVFNIEELEGRSISEPSLPRKAYERSNGLPVHMLIRDATINSAGDVAILDGRTEGEEPSTIYYHSSEGWTTRFVLPHSSKFVEFSSDSQLIVSHGPSAIGIYRLDKTGCAHSE